MVKRINLHGLQGAAASAAVLLLLLLPQSPRTLKQARLMTQ